MTTSDAHSENTDSTTNDEVFTPHDPTNGLADVDGDSDGTAESDTKSAAQRGDEDDLTVPPVIPAGPAGTHGQ